MAFNLLKMLGLGAKSPNVPEVPSYESLYNKAKSSRIGSIEDLLYGYGNQRLQPGYEAINPQQQNMIYNRIAEQLNPDFEKNLKGQEQAIYNMGIQGSPGASILGQLRKDYMNDLGGRATDIAIQNISQTANERGQGINVLDALRNSLMGEASNIAGQTRGEQESARNISMGLESQRQQQNTDLLSNIGNFIGNIGLSAATGGGSNILQSLTNFLGGKKKTTNDFSDDFSNIGWKNKDQLASRMPSYVY